VKPAESEVAATVVAYFEAIGADVYQEVAIPGGVADIVARVGVEYWIVEVKTQLSLALLIQAMNRRRLSHRVYVAAPMSRTLRDFVTIAAELGIGVLTVFGGIPDAHWSFDQPRVTEEVASRKWNTRATRLAGLLRPEHKTHAQAGSVGAAGRWTPWRDTCEQLAQLVRERPGITLKEAVDGIRHHYRSAPGACSSLLHWIEAGRITGVRLDRSTAPITLQPAEAA
jgi:hypothetical protein